MTLRVGSKPPHQTIYDEDERMVAVGITPADAAWIVEQVDSAERLASAVERALALAEDALHAWRPERDYHRERADRKGYSMNETAAEVYGDAIKAMTEILAALDQPEEAASHPEGEA